MVGFDTTWSETTSPTSNVSTQLLTGPGPATGTNPRPAHPVCGHVQMPCMYKRKAPRLNRRADASPSAPFILPRRHALAWPRRLFRLSSSSAMAISRSSESTSCSSSRCRILEPCRGPSDASAPPLPVLERTGNNGQITQPALSPPLDHSL